MPRRPWWIERTHNAEGAGGGSSAGAASGADKAPAVGGLVDAAKAAGAQGAAGQGQGAAGQDQGAAGQGQQGQQGQQPAPYLPEGLADAFKGKTDRETIDKLWAAEQGRAKAPAAAADYKLELPKELEGVIDPKNDKVLPLWRDIAHKHGLSQPQFNGVIVDLQTAMQKAGLIEKPIVLADEFAALGHGAGDRAAQEQKGQQRVLELATKLDGLATRQTLTKDEAQLAVQLLSSRQTVQLFEKLLALAPSEKGLQGGGQGGGGDTVTPYQKALNGLYPTMANKGAA